VPQFERLFRCETLLEALREAPRTGGSGRHERQSSGDGEIGLARRLVWRAISNRNTNERRKLSSH
jgi:hypothetical protein